MERTSPTESILNGSLSLSFSQSIPVKPEKSKTDSTPAFSSSLSSPHPHSRRISSKGDRRKSLKQSEVNKTKMKRHMKENSSPTTISSSKNPINPADDSEEGEDHPRRRVLSLTDCHVAQVSGPIFEANITPTPSSVAGGPSILVDGDAEQRALNVATKGKNVPIVKFQAAPPSVYNGGLAPVNAAEQKALFFKCGMDPVFQLKGTEAQVENLIRHGSARIHFHLFNEAKRILDAALQKYSYLDDVVEAMYGPKISLDTAVSRVNEYIMRHKLQKEIEVIWCRELACSAQMSSTGPEPRLNKPHERKYTLLVKSSSENSFLRENGIDCLMDHEIGTHFDWLQFRSYNDGYQVWYSDRVKFGLGSPKTYEGMKTEEGFACLNTLLQANVKLLCMPALLYYASCLAEYLTFRELFDHLGRFMRSEEQRWKHCMRVKRGLKDVNQTGGYGKDQRYFEGAVEILRNMEMIDFDLLIGGKVLWTETSRLQSVARRDLIRYPHFMCDFKRYQEALRKIAFINGITIEKKSSPSANGPTNTSPVTSKVSSYWLTSGRQEGVKNILALPEPSRHSRQVRYIRRATSARERALGVPSCGCALFTTSTLGEAIQREKEIKEVANNQRQSIRRSLGMLLLNRSPATAAAYLEDESQELHQIPMILELNMFQPIDLPPY